MAPNLGAQAPALIVPARAAEAWSSFGDLSPLAGGDVIYEAPRPAREDPLLAARRVRMQAAERKLAAARALMAAGMGSEALGLLHGALALVCRALDERGDPGEDPAALMDLVYRDLI